MVGLADSEDVELRTFPRVKRATSSAFLAAGAGFGTGVPQTRLTYDTETSSAAMTALIRFTTPLNEMPDSSSQSVGASGETQAGVRPVVIVVMGVSGSGKTTVAAMLAGRLNWQFEEADNLHSAASIAKMSRGVPLTDDDRWPWLHSIAAVIAGWIAQGQCGVIACSVLKRVYRRIIINDNRAVRLVYLKGSRELILQRMAARHGHFMPLSLLDSQFATLEEPTFDEQAIVVPIDRRPEEIVTEIAAAVSTG